MRRLSARLQDARRAARLVLRARRRRRRSQALHVRTLQRLLRRPDREEAAESFPAGHLGAVVRHRRLQSRLQVLPELGHEQVARDGHARRSRDAGACSRRRRSAWAAQASRTRTTIQSCSWSTRWTSPTLAASVACSSVAVTAGYMCPQPRAEFYRHMDAANVDLKGVHRALLSQDLRRRARRGARDARVSAARDARCGSRSRRC